MDITLKRNSMGSTKTKAINWLEVGDFKEFPLKMGTSKYSVACLDANLMALLTP